MDIPEKQMSENRIELPQGLPEEVEGLPEAFRRGNRMEAEKSGPFGMATKPK